MAPRKDKQSLQLVAAPAEQKHYISYPQETLDHWISDGELDQLSELRKDYVVELFWGFLGMAIGSALPAFLLFDKIGSVSDPIGKADLFALCTFFIFLALSIVMGVFWRQRSKHVSSLTDKIRSRPKAPVGGPNGPVESK